MDASRGPDGEVSFRVLGPVDVTVGGRSASLGGMRSRAVLAMLLLARGRAVPGDDLVDALWGENQPREARNSLQSHISRLRRALAASGGRDTAGRLRWSPGGYRLVTQPGELDLSRVEELLARGRSARAGNPAETARLLAEALSHWRGAALADLATLPGWQTCGLAASRARIDELEAIVREEMLEARLAAGAHVESVPELEQAAVAQPLREGTHRLLALALHRAGRQTDALAVLRRYRDRLVDETGLDPSAQLGELEQAILAGDPALSAPAVDAAALEAVPARAVPPGWRAPADRLVGRAAELAALHDTLTSQRLVTITGPGGVGKTRLARQVVDRLIDHHQVFVVELSDVSADADVVAAAAVAFGLRAAPRGIETGIADFLGEDPALLVLDNCEHLGVAVRELTGRLLERCPKLGVLATSRQRLDHPAEQVIRLGPLAHEDAVELFLDRVGRLRLEFDPTPHARDVAGQICGSVDGLPLAVELAARREAVFGLSQLKDRLSTGLDVLGPARDGHRTTAVVATVEWSYRLLDPDAQRLFDHLSVCRGGFVADTVDYLCQPATSNPLALLADLVEASLVICDLTTDQPRYRLLEVMRRVGASHLSDDEQQHVSEQHTRWMESVVDTIHGLHNQRSSLAPTLVHAESPNLRVALSWLVETAQWERAGRIGLLVALALADDPCLSLLGQLHRTQPPPHVQSNTLCTATVGAASWLQGDADRAVEMLTEALHDLPADFPMRWVVVLFRLWAGLYRSDLQGVEDDVAILRALPTTPRWATATAVCCAALMRLWTGDRPAAEQRIDGERQLLDAIGEVDGFVHYTYAELAVEVDAALALDCFDRAQRLCEAQGHHFKRELATLGRVVVLIRGGHYEAAIPECLMLIESLAAIGMWPQLWILLRVCAELLAAHDDFESAAELLTAEARDPLAPVLAPPESQRRAALWELISDRLEPARLASARAEGERMGRPSATRRALVALQQIHAQDPAAGVHAPS